MKIEKRQELEHRLIRKLVRVMKEHGWAVQYVNDGGDCVKCPTEAAVMDTVFSVDESWIRFKKGDDSHVVFIVLGNDGYDAIADYGYSDPDLDGFKAIMESEISAYQDKLEREVS